MQLPACLYRLLTRQFETRLIARDAFSFTRESLSVLNTKVPGFPRDTLRGRVGLNKSEVKAYQP